MKKVADILAVMIVLPIWYYLLYKILVAVQATELMMFLFWIYLPVGMVVSIMQKVLQDK